MNAALYLHIQNEYIAYMFDGWDLIVWKISGVLGLLFS